MSSIDLAAAVESAARAIQHNNGRAVRYVIDNENASAAIRAAAPLIEAAVREQVARDIEAYRGDPWREDHMPSSVGNWIDSRDATQAARIARGES